jgi:hypothetical protein
MNTEALSFTIPAMVAGALVLMCADAWNNVINVGISKFVPGGPGMLILSGYAALITILTILAGTFYFKVVEKRKEKRKEKVKSFIAQRRSKQKIK